MNKFSSGSVLVNFLWRFAERFGAEIVGFVVSMILARMLAPELYGTLALVTVFTAVLEVFIDSGFGNALIQKKDADDLDFSTVFYFNMVVCITLYAAMFFAAPLIAKFYDKPELTAVVRVISLTLILSGVKNVQQAYVSRNMQFKRFFFATLGGTVGAAVIGLVMAYNGCGIWALVVQMLFNNTVDTVILWITVDWRPKKMFSFRRLKDLFGFGWKLLASALLDTAYGKLRQLIIGKMYSSSDLAYYNRGDSMSSTVIGNVSSSIDSVLFPTLSASQDDPAELKKITRLTIKTSTYIIAPFLMGLAATGTPLVRLLLTDKWLPAVPYMCIFCVTYMFYPIHTANLNALKALGRSDLFLKLEIIKKIMDLILILCTMWFGVMAMALSTLVSSVGSQIINTWPNKKLLGYSYLEQLRDILPGILLAVFMGLCVYPFRWLGLSDIVTLCIQVPVGAIIYIGGSVLLKLESFQFLWGMVKPYLGKAWDKLRKKA